jgi:3-deoxy-D-manno-octulosonate 8-phosphate phosphatase (KDO 8-P phosphatase)
VNIADLERIRLVAFDVDGVLTDGRFYLADDGTESKAFNTQDGYGIRQLLEAGIAVAVISGRKSAAVAKRMLDLGVEHVVQGCSDKVAALDEIIAPLGIAAAECAYAGDDLPDLPLLGHVGFAIAVANAVPALHQQCDFSTSAGGGQGAVREICELILSAQSQ